jgi:hypothetical protein
MLEIKTDNMQEIIDDIISAYEDKGAFVQISIDTETGEIYSDCHVSFGRNSWSEYQDKAVKFVGYYSRTDVYGDESDMEGTPEEIKGYKAELREEFESRLISDIEDKLEAKA